MLIYKNKWALVTGASSGIGECFAKELAKRGANLILVARREDRLQALAQELKQYNVNIHIIPLDLAKLDAPQRLYAATQKLNCPVNILINNAGFGVYGKLAETDLKRNEDLIMVNIFAVFALTHLYLPEMVRNKDGIIINVASTAAFQPLPYMSNYGASKAYVLSLTEALWSEYHTQGIRILAFCPGPVATEFSQAMGSRGPSLGKSDTSEDVVNDAFRALEKDSMTVLPGSFKNKFIAFVVRFFPRRFIASSSEKVLKPKD